MKIVLLFSVLKKPSNVREIFVFLKEQSELRDIWAQEICCCNFYIVKNNKQL